MDQYHLLTRRDILRYCSYALSAASLTSFERPGLMAEETEKPQNSKLATAIIHDDIALKHITGNGHPESPARYKAVMTALKKSDFAQSLKFIQPKSATDDDVERCHDKRYIAAVKRDIAAGMDVLSTGDTAVCRDSLAAALHAAGAARLAVDLVMESKAKNSFCVMRPPGHHATPNKGMGFCIFNNVAIAARYAQKKYNIEKVLIADWDVHHGNGTQDIFYEDESVFFFSTHQSPWYPGTGEKEETGRGHGLGTTMNRPFPAGSGRKEIVGAFRDELVVAADRFKPDLIIISAGFDSRAGDPLGKFRLTDDDFVELTEIMLKIADEHCNGRLISVLEGGYNLTGLATAATVHCRRLHIG